MHFWSIHRKQKQQLVFTKATFGIWQSTGQWGASQSCSLFILKIFLMQYDADSIKGLINIILIHHGHLINLQSSFQIAWPSFQIASICSRPMLWSRNSSTPSFTVGSNHSAINDRTVSNSCVNPSSWYDCSDFVPNSSVTCHQLIPSSTSSPQSQFSYFLRGVIMRLMHAQFEAARAATYPLHRPVIMSVIIFMTHISIHRVDDPSWKILRSDQRSLLQRLFVICSLILHQFIPSSTFLNKQSFRFRSWNDDAIRAVHACMTCSW